MLRTGIEVGEGIDLLEQLTVLVPGTAVYLAAPYVGDGKDKAPVQQGQAMGAESRINCMPVGTIAIEQ